MKIPPRLSDLLQKDDRLTGAIHYAISVSRPWFEDNKLVFFPEYTDHGPKHIQEVVETAESLIGEYAWAVLRAEDAAALILGIILHDCAMHVSEDGFISLLSGDSRPHNNDFGDKPWPQLWNEFMTEARRFDERKLKSLFDDVEPVRPPALDPMSMTKRDRLLIGEFLRRHHPRLAHEIALTGVPGPPSKGLSLGNIPQDIKELAGIVARSHGLDLRVCVDHLNHKSKWGARRTAGVHVTYLMVLVRIADYLQIHSARAPQEVLKVRSLRSPVSRGEWNAHAAIKDIHQETDDPEALWVEAMPEDAQTYLKLTHLLSDIQRELDNSWGVLGEVYGPKEELRSLGIKLRRIKSNLQDPESFAKRVSYVPCHAAIRTAGVELLKLLITPLYGDVPGIGIRELLQNAVDACLELQDYITKHPQSLTSDIQAQSADVVIALEEKEDGTRWIIVSDKGVGMTVDTILNYFLKAGASFRNSHAWREMHEDRHGRIQVPRSGRFGIGVLAGFLLGEEIHVTTRHVTAAEDEGLSFTCRLEDEVIQLERTHRPIGTTVSIQISESLYDNLVRDERRGGGLGWWSSFWDWYCLREPSVERVVGNGRKRLRQTYTLPSVNSQLPPSWRRTQHPDYQDIHWSFTASAPSLTCNGIEIFNPKDNRDDFKGHYQSNWHHLFNYPKLSVFDPYANLPLNLQRTQLITKSLSFNEQLILDVCRDILAYLIVFTPSRRPHHRSAFGRVRQFGHPGLSSAFWYWFSREGVALLDSWNVQQLQPARLIVLTGDLCTDVIEDGSFQPYIPYFKPPSIAASTCYYHKGWINVAGRRVLIDRYSSDHVEDNKSYEARGFWAPNVKEHTEWESEHWILLRTGVCPPIDFNLEELHSDRYNSARGVLASLYPSEQVCEDHPLAVAWRETIGLPFIPYDMTERRSKLAMAYQQLGTQIQAWEEVKRTKRRSKP
jgi:hypothetical protein